MLSTFWFQLVNLHLYIKEKESREARMAKAVDRWEDLAVLPGEDPTGGGVFVDKNAVAVRGGAG